jgi:hypothetical protein
MDKDRLVQLLNKDTWTREDKKWLLIYLEATDTRELEALLAEQFGSVDAAAPPDAARTRVLLESIHERIAVKRMPVMRLGHWRLVLAASLVGLVMLTTYYLVYRDNKKAVVQNKIPARKYKNDVKPGTNKAILILADGSKVVLDDTQNGLVTRQGSTTVIKLGSKLSYRDSSLGATKIVYNTIATPRAAQYQVELPDGSMVWLNAASSLRFPTAFTGGERRVEVTGEVYFEIATLRHRSGQAIPFIVTVNGAAIQVLGTHFNVMAYDDEEALKTTLLEGKVKVASMVNGEWSMLKPGQQAAIHHLPAGRQGSQLTIHDDVNTANVTAWKNGLFDFDNASIETVMRQLSRWYDVEVIFKSHNNKDQFMLEMPRSSKLSDILKILELTGNIKFEIDGKKVIVFA